MPEQLEFRYDVFISYSSHDKQWVQGVLLKRIEEAGLRAFIDFRDFEPGAPSINEIERSVTACRKTLLILTPPYIDSDWCEIERIMLQTLSPANRDLRLSPLLKVRCENLPLSIRALNHIDFTESADSDLAWDRLLTALDALPQQSAEKAIPAEIQTELDRANAFMDADKFSQAIPILKNALTAADGSGHTIARVQARMGLAQAVYEAHEDFIGAERHFRDSLNLVPINNLDLKHKVLRGLGDMLIVAGRLDEAKATIHMALDVAKLTDRREYLAGSLMSLSMLEQVSGFHDSAIAKLDEAVHLLLQEALSLPEDKTKSNAHMLAACYTNKALLYQEAGSLDEALTLYEKANTQHQISGDKLHAGRVLLFCGEVHWANAEWEKAFNCFLTALECFKEADNPLWGARNLAYISHLYATHERWDEALSKMFVAAGIAEESGYFDDQVHFLCLATKFLRNWKMEKGEQNIVSLVRNRAKDIPQQEQAEVISSLFDATRKAVREDEQVRDLMNQAKQIAQREHLHERLADCLLNEAHNITPPDDTKARRNLIAQAIKLLKEELGKAQSPKRRGDLMNRISALHRELSERSRALSWLKKAGEIFEKSGDVFGLANFHKSLAGMHKMEG